MASRARPWDLLEGVVDFYEVGSRLTSDGRNGAATPPRKHARYCWPLLALEPSDAVTVRCHAATD